MFKTPYDSFLFISSTRVHEKNAIKLARNLVVFVALCFKYMWCIELSVNNAFLLVFSVSFLQRKKRVISSSQSAPLICRHRVHEPCPKSKSNVLIGAASSFFRIECGKVVSFLCFIYGYGNSCKEMWNKIHCTCHESKSRTIVGLSWAKTNFAPLEPWITIARITLSLDTPVVVFFAQ